LMRIIINNELIVLIKMKKNSSFLLKTEDYGKN
jgi:hypothetical protein